MASESPSRPRLCAALSPALAGMRLAAGITREAVDDVPVAKEVVGALGKIFALAEKIERDREALRALVETVSKLSRRLKEVVGDKELDPVLQPSLDRLYKAFKDVDEFTVKHRKRNPFLRVAHYAFTVKDDVDRLKRNMDDSMAEIYTVALVSVKAQVGAMQRTIEENAQYDGQFRLLRSSDILKLELLEENEFRTEDGRLVVRYHKARVNQEFLAVRFVLGTPPEQPRAAGPTERKAYDEMSFRERMAYHDDILKDISTFQNSHPNVAAMYGRSTGAHIPFTVFKSGFLPYFALWRKPGGFLTNAIHCTFKLQAAAAHLRTLGITWKPRPWPPSVKLNEYLEPIIGLDDDLHRSNSGNDPVEQIEAQVLATNLDNLWYIEPAQARKVSSTDFRAAMISLIDGRLVPAPSKYSIYRTRYIIFKSDFAGRYALSGDTAERLRSVMDHVLKDVNQARFRHWEWPQLLFMLNTNRSHMRRVTTQALFGRRGQSGHLEIRCLGEDSERIVLDKYSIDILPVHLTSKMVEDWRHTRNMSTSCKNYTVIE